MKVKVDFAPENKEKDPNRIGTYAIYSKRHWWIRWKIEMNGNIPAIYRKKNGGMVEVL